MQFVSRLSAAVRAEVLPVGAAAPKSALLCSVYSVA